MKSRNQTLQALRRHVQAQEAGSFRAQLKQAGLEDDDVRAVGPAARHSQESGGSMVKRAIPKDYDYDPQALKPLASMLWALSISLGHAMTAHREFTKLKSATISPDGLIGGRGYVMSVKDIRSALHAACEAISSVSDAIHDEVHAPHWRPRLAELERQDVESVERLVGDADRILEDPEKESEAQESIEKAEQEGQQAELEDGSNVPDARDMPDSESATVKTASKSLLDRVMQRWANSSVPVETEAGGPRVQHMDRGDTDQTGPFGSYNQLEPQSIHDPWSKDQGVGNDYAYPSEWENELLSKQGESHVPDHITDSTPTQGWDFGIGYGDGNDAHGQGAGGYGTKAPDGKGVWGPASGMPHDPGGVLHDDTSDSTPAIEMEIGRSNRHASHPDRREGWDWGAQSKLPNDGQPGVARSDYYRGDKGSNPVNVVPSNVGSSSLPDQPDASYDFSLDVQPGLGYRYEQSQPYVKWDHSTHTMRPDDLYQRDPEGPYVKQKG